jgi:hypothetical protein
MENLQFKNRAIAILVATISFYSCGKSTIRSDISIDTTKVYKGIIVAKSCPSYAIVQVSNANIGDDWSFGGYYKNIIGISNCPDSIKVNSSISFNLSTSLNYSDCLIPKPCLQDLIIGKMPSKIYCSRNLRSQ